METSDWFNSPDPEWQEYADWFAACAEMMGELPPDYQRQWRKPPSTIRF